MLMIKRTPLDCVDKHRFEQFEDKTVFTTLEWLRFISDSQQAEPVVLELYDEDKFRGYFTGAIVVKLGFRIFGSPFKGWTTAYMGFNLYDPSDRVRYLKPVLNYVLRDLKCIHAELYDRDIKPAELDAQDLQYESSSGYELDLTQAEEALFASFRNDIRTNVRKFAKSGCVIEEDYSEAFAPEYYRQLQDVFAKQKKVPLYDERRAGHLIRQLRHTGNLLCLKALSPEKRCIATAIFAGFNRMAYFWGGASYREHQHFRPNEALQWHAIRHWKAKGIRAYDMGGAGQYKEKYGGARIAVPWIIHSKYPVIAALRNCAKTLLQKSHAWTFKSTRKSSPVEPTAQSAVEPVQRVSSDRCGEETPGSRAWAAD